MAGADCRRDARMGAGQRMRHVAAEEPHSPGQFLPVLFGMERWAQIWLVRGSQVSPLHGVVVGNLAWEVASAPRTSLFLGL